MICLYSVRNYHVADIHDGDDIYPTTHHINITPLYTFFLPFPYPRGRHLLHQGNKFTNFAAEMEHLQIPEETRG